MKKTIAWLLGTVAALGTIASAQAAPSPATNDALRANSYAELLEPMPNAGAQLQAMDEQQSGTSQKANVQLAYFYRHHHHHHHHHNGFVVRTPFGAFGHHHHHHHHHNYYRRY